MRYAFAILTAGAILSPVFADAGQKRDIMGIRIGMSKSDAMIHARGNDWICPPSASSREVSCKTDFGTISFSTVAGDPRRRIFEVRFEYTLPSRLSQRDLADTLTAQFEEKPTKIDESTSTGIYGWALGETVSLRLWFDKDNAKISLQDDREAFTNARALETAPKF
jgi:hypothetical protein